MKHFIYFTGLFLVLLAGCKKDLDIPDPNNLTTETFWKNASDAQQGVNAAYSTFHRVGLARWLFFITIIRADEGFSTSPNSNLVNVYDAFNLTDFNDGQITSTYQDDYIGINRCNQVLDNVPGIEMDAAVKTQLLGEAHFLRGLFYYNLATLYGNVAIMLHAPTPKDYPGTSPADSVFAQAESDLVSATQMLPATYDASGAGRATRGAAYALLGKAYMQQRKYPEAQAALQYLTEGEGKSQYSLVASYRDNFIETAENNSESVFEFQNAVNPNDSHDDDTQTDGQDALNYGTSIPPFFAPSPIGFTDGEARRWPVWEFLKETTTGGDRDPRLAATFLYDSTDERGPDFSLAFGTKWNDLGLNPDPGAVHNSIHEVCFRKFLDDATMNAEVFHSGNNYRFIRYADVLLLYAEALNAQGNTAAAYPYVDQVRVRAGLPTLTAAHPGLSQDQFLQQLKHERITELTGEGHRWEDLARWGDLGTQLAARDAGFANFKTGRDELLPIPQFDLDVNPNLKQNPGY